MPDSFSFKNPPFDRLNEQERQNLTKSLDIAYYTTDEILINAGESPENLYLIIKGEVKEINGDEVIDFYTSQDTFDAISLIKGKSKNSFVVQEELICYLIPKKLFIELTTKNKSFGQFFSESLAEKQEHQLSIADTQKLASFMVARIGDAYLHSQSIVEPETTIRDASIYMRDKKITSLLVKKAGKVGFVSGINIRDAVVISGKSTDTLVADIAVFDHVTIDVDDFLFDAQVLMTKHHIRSIPVMENGEITGVLELTDLLSYISDHSHLVALKIDRAEDIKGLEEASKSITPMIFTLHSRGTKIQHLTELVTDLNRKIFKRLFEFIAPPEMVKNSCLIVMGSEGRREQVLKTDQDNALILRDDSFYEKEVRRVCEAFTKALLDFGYPPCKGNMMVSNPEWSKSQKEYKTAIKEWILKPDGKTHVKLAAFVDSQPVAGDFSIFEDTRSYLLSKIVSNDSFFSHFTKPIITFDTPLGIFKQLQVEKGLHSGRLDIKTGGIFPIVHGVRALALENGLLIGSSNTFDRIDALVEKDIIEKAFAKNLKEAFQFLLNLKLTALLGKSMSGESVDRFVQTHTLSKLERDLLKESLHIVREFKSILVYHFKLSLFSP